MTDYIEMVLGAQEDTEERENPMWEADMTGSIPARGGALLETQGTGGGGGSSLGHPFELPEPSPREPFLEKKSRGQAVGTVENGLPRRYEYRLAMTANETRRQQAEASGAVEGLRGRLRRAEVAAGYRGETAAMEVREEWSGNRGRSVLELDAAFSRDARRYDNGFELF